MENGKQHDKGKDQQQEDRSEKYQRPEHEGENDNQYSEDQGEDENGPKPSADEQD
jgi:hypothetical protein